MKKTLLQFIVLGVIFGLGVSSLEAGVLANLKNKVVETKNKVKEKVIAGEAKIKQGAVSVYKNSFQGIGNDVKNMVIGSKEAIAAAKEGSFKGFVKGSAKTFSNFTDAVTLGSAKNGAGMVKNYAGALNDFAHGRTKEGALKFEEGAIHSFKLAGGPVGTLLGPRSAQELNQVGKAVGQSAVGFGKSVKTMAQDVAHGHIKIKDLQNVVDAGAKMEDSASKLVATAVTNVGAFRSGIQGGINYFGHATQKMGQGVVDATAAAGDLSRGEFKKATKDTVKSMSNMAAGGGKILSVGTTLVGVTAGNIPVVGMPLRVGASVIGAGANIAGANQEIYKHMKTSFKEGIAGGKELFTGGNKKEGLKKLGKSLWEDVKIGGIVATGVVGGGAGGVAGNVAGKVGSKIVIQASQQMATKIGKGAGRIISGTNLASKYAFTQQPPTGAGGVAGGMGGNFSSKFLAGATKGATNGTSVGVSQGAYGRLTSRAGAQQEENGQSLQPAMTSSGTGSLYGAPSQ